MLAAVAVGIPVITAVPGVLIGEWIAFTGGRTDLLLPTAPALWRWWGPRRLYADLVQGVAEAEVRRVVIGLNWTMVEGPDGIGLAQTPERGTPGCVAAPRAGYRAGGSLRQLAALANSTNPFDAALGIAAFAARIWAIYVLLKAMGSSSGAIAGWIIGVSIGAVIPLLALILLLIINQQATGRLQRAGLKVGLMGAKLPT